MTAWTINNEVIADLPPKLLPWVIWGMAALFYLYEFFLHISTHTMIPELMHDFSVASSELGNLSSFYFYAFALMQIPVGLMLDYFGSRKTLTMAAIICAVGSFAFGTTHVLYFAEFYRLILGLGAAFTLLGCLKLAAEWFPSNQFTLLAGVMIMISMLCALGGHPPFEQMVDVIGWRESVMMLGVIGGFLSLFIWFIIRDKPEKNPDTNQIEKSQTTQSFLSKVLPVLRNRQTWLCAIYSGLMFAPTTAFGVFSGVPFLMQTYDLSQTHASELLTMIFIGWAFGSPFAGWISDRVKKRLPPMLIGSVAALFTLFFILYIDMPIALLGFTLFAFGFFSSGLLPDFSIVKESNETSANGTALSILTSFYIFGGLIIQALIATILDFTGPLVAITPNNLPLYTSYDLNIALSALPITIAVALLILPFIKETHCRNLAAEG